MILIELNEKNSFVLSNLEFFSQIDDTKGRENGKARWGERQPKNAGEISLPRLIV